MLRKGPLSSAPSRSRFGNFLRTRGARQQARRLRAPDNMEIAMRFALALVCLVSSSFGATKLAVSVVERRSGRFVEGLKAEDFTILDDKSPRAVESIEITPAGPLDVMLLLDTSLAGPAVQPF